MAEPDKPQAEEQQIRPLFGPYRGKIISVPKADAQSAISDGWAVDPHAPPPPPPKEGETVEPPKQPSDEDVQRFTEAADKAARKWRGEDEAGKAAAEQNQGQEKTRDMTPEGGGQYNTRSAGRAPMSKAPREPQQG